MNALDLSSLRAGLPDCPSDLALDRLHAGELAGEEQAGLTTHVRDCSTCAARLAERSLGFAAFAGLDPARLLARVERERPAAPSPWERLRAWLARPALGFTAMASLALALLLVWRKPEGQEGEHPGLRQKGSLALHVHRLRGEHSEEALSGDRFAPGDRLRFGVDLTEPGYLAILGLEADGDLYTAWPLGDGPGSAHRKAGAGQLLEGAVTLDDAQGLETLYLVQCSDAAALRTCSAAGGRELRCAASCTFTPFTLDKRP